MNGFIFSPSASSLDSAVLSGEAGRIAFRGKVSNDDDKQNDKKIFIVHIIISALIFIAVIAIYEVIRSIIANNFAARAIEELRDEAEEKDIHRIIVTNYASTGTNVVFAMIAIFILICVVSAFYF